MSINHVVLLGNLTRTPELRYTPSGSAVCQVGLALDRRWTTPAGELQQETAFVEAGERRSRLKVVGHRVTFLTRTAAAATAGAEPSANGIDAQTADGEAVPDWVTEEV